MRPILVRKRVLGDHAYLRDLLDEVDRQACRVAGGAAAGVATLRVLGLRLLGEFGRHLALEDRLLAPALRRAGPAGRERADRLEIDHREQRELLDYLLGKLRDPGRPAAVLADEWRSFVELLLDDMAQEELTILDERLLEDPGAGGEPPSTSLGRVPG